MFKVKRKRKILGMDSRYAKIYRNKNPGIWDVKIDFLKLKEKAKESVIQGCKKKSTRIFGSSNKNCISGFP